MNRRYGEKFLKKVVSIVEHNEKFFAILGKADGTVKADDYSRVYVRDWSGKVSIVYNDVVPLEPGRLVNVWRNKRTKRMEIIGFANLYPTERQIELPYHAESHQWPNGDTLFVRPEQFMGGGLVVPVIGELELEIVGYYYKLGANFYALDNKTGDNALDLSGEVPSSGSEWVNIEVDDNGDISYNHGTNKDSPYLLTLQDIPATTIDKRLICSVKLYEGQVEFNKEKGEIFDPRFTGDGTGGIADAVEWHDVQNKPTEFNPDLDVTDPRYPRIYTFASAPTENDDNTEGYKIGDLWIDTSSLIAYRAVDVSTGAAVWISGNGSGGAIIFHVEGALAVVDDVSISFIITGGTSITNWYFMLENTGSSGSTILDIILNGTTSIFQDDYTDNRPIITYDDADGLVKAVAIITDFVENDILTVNIDQIANGASDLSIMSEGISGSGNNYNLIVEDESAIVSVSNVGKIVVPDGVLADNGGGQVTLDYNNLVVSWEHTSDVTSVDIQIPSDALTIYRVLKCYIFLRTDRASQSLEGVRLRFSTAATYDTGNNYARYAREVGDAAVTENTNAGDSIWVGRFSFAGNTADANVFGDAELTITGFDSASAKTNVSGKSGVVATSSVYRFNDFWGLWKNTGLVDGLRFYTANGSNFKSGSYIKIYGVR